MASVPSLISDIQKLSIAEQEKLFKNDKKIVKIKSFMVQCNVTHTYTKIINFRKEIQYFFSYIHYIQINIIINI